MKKERDFTNISHLFENMHNSFEDLEVEEEKKKQFQEIYYFAYYKHDGSRFLS